VGWGWLTADLRMQPSFLIVGVQRCGTTTMYRLLSDHPDVRRPTISKGIGYFDRRYEKGPRWYRAQFPVSSLAGRLGRDGRPPVSFESSGYYCYHPLAAGRIARDLPQIKLVVLVRDPVERAYSAYKHELARGFETETFERALALEPERLAGEVERMLTDPTYESFSHRHHSYVARGQYAEQIVRLHEAVGKDAVYVIDADHFFADPGAEFAALTEWLGLTWRAPDSVQRWNARPGEPIPAAIRRRLLDHFEPHDAALAELTGRMPSWR
jgi:hypothetical protein